jgi:hypothetical protein
VPCWSACHSTNAQALLARPTARRALPPHCDCLLHWSAEQKLALQGTSIADSATVQETERAYQLEVAPQVASRPDLWPDCTAQQFMVAAGLVQSRVFHLEATCWLTG